ncbi:hypothetical protein [Rhizobium leguminosarum]|nr:hypothetical protein [Rhizobium leguminosarum]TBH13469.1 hypothetical protein ELG68_21095 [Rhizobium leguminosarum]
MRDKQTIVAYHEAGHAVAHWLARIAIESITIDRVGEEHPRVKTDEASLQLIPFDEAAPRLLIIAGAGYSADLIHLKLSDPQASPYQLDGYQTDQRQAYGLLDQMGLKFPNEGFYKHEAHEQLRQPETWLKVALVAEQVLCNRTMTRVAFEDAMAGLEPFSDAYWTDLEARRQAWWRENFG